MEQERQSSLGKSAYSSTPKPSEYGRIKSLLMVFTLQISRMPLINPCLDFDPPRNFFHFYFMTPFPAVLHPTQSTGLSFSCHTPLYLLQKALCLPWMKISDSLFPVLRPSLFYWHLWWLLSYSHVRSSQSFVLKKDEALGCEMNKAEFLFKTIFLCPVGNMILLTMYNGVTDRTRQRSWYSHWTVTGTAGELKYLWLEDEPFLSVLATVKRIPCFEKPGRRAWETCFESLSFLRLNCLIILAYWYPPPRLISHSLYVLKQCSPFCWAK